MIEEVYGFNPTWKYGFGSRGYFIPHRETLGSSYMAKV